MTARVVDRVGRVSAMEWLALAAGFAVFAYVGWDSALWDARLQLVLHLIGFAAAGAVAVRVVRGLDVPRTPLELPILGLLAAFALATAGAINLGMSLRAMAAITAFAAMLPVALIAIRYRPTWVGLVTSVPVLALAIPTLVVLVGRRIEWVLVGAPGLPPLRLLAEGTPFGSVAVPPFILIPAWALAGLIEPGRPRRAIRIGLVVVGLPLVVLSGSRSAWLAIAAGVAVGVLPWAWSHRRLIRWPARVTPLGIVVGAASLGVATLAFVLVLPRLTAVTSLLYRGALWRDTLTAWGSDPLTGIGPGFMAYARQAAATDFSFPVRQPHSHNLLLGVLGDAGVIGLAAGLLAIGSLVVLAGPWRSRTGRGRTAAVVLVGIGIGGLFEDLTFLPGFNLLVILLIAVALEDAGAVAWRRVSLGRWRRVAALGLAGTVAVVLGAAMVTADAGASGVSRGRPALERSRLDRCHKWLCASRGDRPVASRRPPRAGRGRRRRWPDLARRASCRAGDRAQPGRRHGMDQPGAPVRDRWRRPVRRRRRQPSRGDRPLPRVGITQRGAAARSPGRNRRCR